MDAINDMVEEAMRLQDSCKYVDAEAVFRRLAVAALNEALALRPAEEAPADRADTQTDLGLAHHAWFRETRDPAQLQQAIDAYGKALDIDTAETSPPRHGRLQRLLGNAYRDRIEGYLIKKSLVMTRL